MKIDPNSNIGFNPSGGGSGSLTSVAAIIGGAFKVDTVATTNITLSGEQTINGFATNASLVLCTGQTDQTQNGIYTTDAADWSRPTWYDTDGEIRTKFILVQSGTLTEYIYQNSNATAISIGVTNITYNNFLTFTQPLRLSSLVSKNILGTDVNGNIFDNSRISYFDATVGSGETYTTVADAIAASKFLLRITSNVTEIGNIVLTNNVYITFSSPTLIWNLAGYNITGAYTIEIERGIVTIANSGTSGTFRCSNILNRITINNNSTSNSNPVIGTSVVTKWNNIVVNLPNFFGCGISGNGTQLDIRNISLKDVNFVGGGANCYYALRVTSSVIGNIATYESIYTSGTFNTTYSNYVLYFGGYVGIKYVYTTSLAVFGCYAENVYVTNLSMSGNTTFICVKNFVATNVYGLDLSNITALYENGLITGAYAATRTGGMSKWINVKFSSTVNIVNDGNDYQEFIGCIFGSTVAINAAYIRITGGYIGGAITVNGNYCILNNIKYNAGIIVAGDYLQINGGYVGVAGGGSKTITINASADNTTVDGTKVEADIIDGGTNSDLNYKIF